PARSSRGRLRVRATVDRAGLDPQGRLPKIQVRRVRKGDLSKVRDVFEQTFGDFLERQLGTRPRQAFGGAQYVHHRWLMEPWGCFVAEEDNAKIVGAALAVTWGTVGILGPVAVLTNYQNQTIGQQLIRAAQEFFEENKAALAPLHRSTNAICRGMDLSKEVEIVDGLALGDTLLLERGRDLVGFAICHTPGVSEAPAGALYVKFLAIDPPKRKVEHLVEFVAALEALGQELGMQRVILPVYSRYWLAYATLVQSGYQIDFTMVRMQRGKQEDYENPTHLVLDDWR